LTELLLASRNPKKLAEMRRIFAPAVPALTVLGLDDVEAYDEVPESGATFADNALIKAREGYANTGLPTVADDSGLAVDA
jgi:XTP/dITP diphosphohydrolase